MMEMKIQRMLVIHPYGNGYELMTLTEYGPVSTDGMRFPTLDAAIHHASQSGWTLMIPLSQWRS